MSELTHYEEVVERNFNPLRRQARKALALARANGEAIAVTIGHTIVNTIQSIHPEEIQKFNMKYAALMMELMLDILERQEGSTRFSYSPISQDADFFKSVTGVGNFLHELGASHNDITNILSRATMIYYHTVTFELAGKRVYEVSPGLGEQLADTELRGVMTDDLRLPYESLYLVVPPQAHLRVYNGKSGWHRCVGLYITEDHDLRGSQEHEMVGEWEHGNAELRGWRIMAVGENKGGFENVLNHDDAIVYFRIVLPAGQLIDDAMGWHDHDFAHKTVEERQGSVVAHSWKEMQKEWSRIFRWLMNVALYVTHVEPGEKWMMNEKARRLWARMQKLPKKSGKRDKLKNRFQSLDPRYRRVLGSKIVVNRKTIQANGEKSGIKRKVLQVKTRVAGHWKRVVQCKVRELRRWQWIAPYWKFKGGIELSGKAHEVK